MSDIKKAFSEALRTVEAASKDGSNPHFKSRYLTLDAVQDVVVPALAAKGLAYSQLPDYIPDDQCVAVTTTIWDEEGGSFELGVTRLPVPKLTPQDAGSAFSYAKRYALTSLFAIRSDIDDDGERAMRRGQMPNPEPVQKPAPKYYDKVGPDGQHPDEVPPWNADQDWAVGTIVIKGKSWILAQMSIQQLSTVSYVGKYSDQARALTKLELKSRAAAGNEEAKAVLTLNEKPKDDL